MTNRPVQNKEIDKLEKLLSAASSSNPHEAEIAFRKAQELGKALGYEITKADISRERGQRDWNRLPLDPEMEKLRAKQERIKRKFGYTKEGWYEYGY